MVDTYVYIYDIHIYTFIYLYVYICAQVSKHMDILRYDHGRVVLPEWGDGKM